MGAPFRSQWSLGAVQRLTGLWSLLPPFLLQLMTNI